MKSKTYFSCSFEVRKIIINNYYLSNLLYIVRFLEARAVKRKIIYHAGPTNSGKTHSALARFRAANTGVYCGPLRLLATEVAKRTNEAVSTLQMRTPHHVDDYLTGLLIFSDLKCA